MTAAAKIRLNDRGVGTNGNSLAACEKDYMRTKTRGSSDRDGRSAVRVQGLALPGKAG
jgi:hypothetical protein